MQDFVTPPAELLCAQREGHTPATERALPCRKNEICVPAAKTSQTPLLRARATPRTESSCRELRGTSLPRDVCDTAAKKTIPRVQRTKRRAPAKSRLQERRAPCEDEGETEGRGDDEASKALRGAALFGAASTADVSSRNAPTTSSPEPCKDPAT